MIKEIEVYAQALELAKMAASFYKAGEIDFGDRLLVIARNNVLNYIESIAGGRA